jgi:hypothetical protein
MYSSHPIFCHTEEAGKVATAADVEEVAVMVEACDLNS